MASDVTGAATDDDAPLVVITGPTASGKSAVALALAERAGAEIISCDSVAVYRGFDVGAAKPTAAERARVPHHLIDVAAPGEPFTAARFVELADAAIAAARGRGAAPLLSGGTALYLQALLDGLFAAPPPDPAIRARLKAEAARLGWPHLHARLATVDPAAAARISPRDPVRIERALEVHEQTGIPITAHHAAQPRGARHPAVVFVVDPPPAVLDQRIADRADRMLAAGLCDEAARLRAAHPGARALGALGYKEALAFLDGALDEAALREAIRRATRRFARRQRTFLRKAFPPSPTTRWLPDAAALLGGAAGAEVDRLLGIARDSPRCPPPAPLPRPPCPG